MRTTVDLPPDLAAVARAIARDEHRSLSSVVADLMRRGLQPRDSGKPARPSRNGFPQLDLHGVITTDDVRQADEDE